MMTKTQAIAKCFNICNTNYIHPDYERTVNLRKTYKALITGEGIDYLLKRFNPREDEAAFNQRKELTQIITPAICQIITAPKSRISTVKPLVKEVGYASQKPKEIGLLKTSINNFWGDQSLDEYLAANFLQLENIDPNAFVIFKFNTVEGKVKKNDVYGTEVPCDWVCDFEYANNTLQYLAIKKAIKYDEISTDKTETPTTKEGKFYQFCVDDWEIELSQVDKKILKEKRTDLQNTVFSLTDFGSIESIYPISDNRAIDGLIDQNTYYIITDSEDVYSCIFYNTKAGRVPAIRTGYLRDEYTDGRTCVNFFHKSMPYLLKSVKTVSELDLSQSLHVFLQKLVYAPKCSGVKKENQQTMTCNSGYDVSGNICSACSGSGLMIHTSAQDHISLALPKDPNQAFDLAKLIHYADVKIDIVKWLDEYSDGLVQKAIRAVYSSNTFVENSIVKTATEKTYDMENVYDALRPCASHYSRAWMLGVHLTAVYMSIEKDLIIMHLFPQDFKIESTGQLLSRLQEAKNAGANQYIIAQMQDDLMEAVYADQPLKLKEFQTMQYFNPFASIPDVDIRQKIASGLVTDYDQILYANLRKVIRDVVNKIEDFYNLTRKLQQSHVDTIVSELQATIKAEKLEKQATLINTFSTPN